LKKILLLLVLTLLLVGCGESVAQQTIAQQPTAPAPTNTTVTPLKKTPVPTATADHPDSSIQDAAQGSSHGLTKSGISAGIVWVTDAGAGTSDTIKLDCFNIQQAIWYGLKSTIHADGSTTIVKSDFKEVDITFLQGSRVVASCRLTSATVDKIDWTYGDYVGAWTMYDGASMQ
jgi:hypothetical protein